MSLITATIVICCILALAAIVALAMKDLMRLMLSSAASKLAEMFPVWYRASLYFLGAFIMTISDKIGGIFMQDEWPSWPRTVGSCIIGLGSGIIALRAYSDGSSQRLGDSIQAKKDSKGFDTSTFTKQVTQTQIQTAAVQPAIPATTEPIK